MDKTVHKIKVQPQYFRKIIEGSKKYEIRKFDREYKIGDTILLREWEPAPPQEYTGREIEMIIIDMLFNFPGIEKGYVILSTQFSTNDSTKNNGHTVEVDNTSVNGYTYITVKCALCQKLIRSEIIEPSKETYKFPVPLCPECEAIKARSEE